MKTPLSFTKGQTELSRLMNASQALIGWQKLLNRFLPPALQGKTFVMKIERGTLHVAVANGGIASRLRQYRPTLLQLLNQPRQDYLLGDGKLDDLEIVVRQITPASKAPVEKKGISKKGLGTIREAASELPDGSPVQKAMLRLLRHHKT